MSYTKVSDLSQEALNARREYYRQWRKNNPEKIKQYQENNKEYSREYLRKWRKENPEKEKAAKKRYWEKKAAAMHTQSDDKNTSDATTLASKSE